MAERPLSAKLPADLPENWTNQQFISPYGLEVGLDKEYGYNYLNQQINETQKSVNKINTDFDYLSGFPKVVHWSLGEDEDIKTSESFGPNDSTTSTSYVPISSPNQPPEFSVPFDATIVVIISLDCQAYGTNATNADNGTAVSVTFDRGDGSPVVKYRALKVAGVDFLKSDYRQQVRGTISIIETFEDQPAGIPINISLAHRRLASDWGQSVHMGGRSVTYIAYPIYKEVVDDEEEEDVE